MSARDELERVKRIGPPIPTLRDAVPVTYIRCFVCGGDGYIEINTNADGVGQIRDCAYCNGRGQIATEGGEL